MHVHVYEQIHIHIHRQRHDPYINHTCTRTDTIHNILYLYIYIYVCIYIYIYIYRVLTCMAACVSVFWHAACMLTCTCV